MGENDICNSFYSSTLQAMGGFLPLELRIDTGPRPDQKLRFFKVPATLRLRDWVELG